MHLIGNIVIKKAHHYISLRLGSSENTLRQDLGAVIYVEGDPPKGESENRRHERQGQKKSQSKEHYWGHCYRQQETDSASSTHEKHLEHFPELSIWKTGVFIQPEWGLHPSGNGRNINTTALPGCTWYTGSADSLLPLLLRTYWGKGKKTEWTWLWRTPAREGVSGFGKKWSTTASTETRGEQSECVQGPEANAATQNIARSYIWKDVTGFSKE